jgi:hypothetical protein
MDPISVFGILTGAAGLLSSVVKFARYMKRARHSGEQIIRLYDLLNDLDRLKVFVGPDNETFRADIRAIDRLISRCHDLIGDGDPQRSSASGLRFSWPKDLENELKKINDQLNSLYLKLQVYRIP